MRGLGRHWGGILALRAGGRREYLWHIFLHHVAHLVCQFLQKLATKEEKVQDNQEHVCPFLFSLDKRVIVKFFLWLFIVDAEGVTDKQDGGHKNLFFFARV